MKKTNVAFVVIFLLALVIRLVWFFSTDNAGYGDAAGRLNVVQQWLYAYWQIPEIDYLKILNPSLDWLPLHFYLTGSISYLFKDLLYAPRLFTVLISVLTLIPLYKVSLLRYNHTIAIIAAAILAFYGMHIYISGLILSESFYVFFLLWSYYFIERYRMEGDDMRWIVLLSASLFCCCLLRYEGWLFAPLVIAVVPFLKKLQIKKFFILLLMPSIAVCFVMICEVLQGQHPLRGILYSDFEVGLSNRFNGPVDYTSLLPAYLPAYFIAAILIFGHTVRTRKIPEIFMLALYLLPVCPFIVKLTNATVTPQARYLVLYMVPGTIIIAQFIYLCYQKFKLRNTALWFIVIAYILISNISFARQVYNTRLPLKYAGGLMHSARYFRDSISRSRAYIDYGRDLSNCNWMVYADLYDAPAPEAFIDSVGKAKNLNVELFKQRVHKGARYRVDGHEYEWKTWSKAGFDDLLQKNEITHIVLFPGGVLSDYLHFSNPNEVYMHRKFIRLFNQDGYRIYKIE